MIKEKKKFFYEDVECKWGTKCCPEKIIDCIKCFCYEKTGYIYEPQDKKTNAPIIWVRWSGNWDGLQWTGARIRATEKNILLEFIRYFNKRY